MMKRYLRYIYVCVLAMLAVSCQQDEPMDTNEKGMVSYSVQMPVRDASRVVVDGSKVNDLKVEVFEQEGESWKRVWSNKGIEKKNWDDVNVPLLKHRSYKVVFWAQNKDVTAYNTDDLSHITVDYAYHNGGFENVENLDAFYHVDKIDDFEGNTERKVEVELKRPFVFLNIDNQSQYTPVSTTLTLDKVYTSFNPLTGEMSDEVNDQKFTFTGAEEDGTIAACFVFVPSSDTSLGVSLAVDNGTSVTTKEVTIEEIAANHRYNLEGELVGAPINHWNENTELPVYEEENKRYVIQNEAQLAWWMNPVEEELKEGVTEIFIEKDLDMQDIQMDALNLPGDFTLNGNNKTISRLKLSGGLLGDATKIKVHDLIITGAEVVSDASHVGVLVNTLTGSGTFTNVSITNSSATTTSGAAGGMIGYIVRSTEKDRSETLAVQFNNCDLASVSASGSQAEGKFVGLLSGYDNGETLTFDADCSADATVADFVSPYKSTNQSVWCGAIADTYDGWLGDEVYCRGRIQFNDNQFVLRWTGRNGVEPLDANEKLDGITSGKVIYSPTDMAWFQEKNYISANVYLRSDLDMGDNDSEDAPVFRPIQSVKYLDGLKKDKISFSSFDDCYKIQNIKVEKIHANGNGAAFILTGAGGQTHQNLVFEESKIISRHDENIDDIDDSNYGNAYAGTIVCKVTGAYTVQNVKVLNGSVYGVCKMGGLIGYVSGNLQAVNCVVDQCTITNYDPQCINWYYQKEEISSFIAYAKDSFYTDGEVGGLIGFITASSPIITDCSVTNTTIDCTGEADKSVSIGVYTSSGFDENNLSSPLATGKVTIAGRHVNQFIGDIRTQAAGNTITISNPYVENNTYNRDKNEHLYSDVTIKTKTKEWTEGTRVKKYYRTYDCSNTRTYSAIVGCAYVEAVTVNVDALGINKHVGDVQGTVKINNTGISETSTESENQTSGNETEWNGLLPETWQCTYNWKYYSIWNPKGESSFEKFVGDDFSL